MADPHALQLREALQQLRCQHRLGGLVGLHRRAKFASVVVDGVVPAPQHPVVGGQPEVVKLIGGVAHALAVGPTQRLEAGGIEWFGDQHVVVHRHHLVADGRHQAGKRVGRHHHPPGTNLQARAPNDHAGVGPFQAVRRRVVGQATATFNQGLPQPGHQAPGVDQAHVVMAPHPTDEGGRRHLGLYGLPVEHGHPVPRPFQRLHTTQQILQLPVGVGHVQLAHRLPAGVDAVSFQVGK